jgi:hypothetical protein
MGRAYSMHAEKRNACRDLLGKPEGNVPLGRPIRRWENNIKIDFKEIGREIWAAFIWLRVETSGGLLWRRHWTFGFSMMLGNSWMDERLMASWKGLSSMELLCVGLRNWITTFAFVSEMPNSKTYWLHDYALYYLTVGEEHKLQGIQSKVARKIKILRILFILGL